MDVGARLRTAREAQGITLARLAEKTRVRPRILAAIEVNDLAAIPPKPFGRGFIRAYAHEVGLDPERAVHDYFGQFPPTIVDTAPPSDAVSAERDRPSWLIPALIATAAGVGLLVTFVNGWRTADQGSETPIAVGTSGATSASPATTVVTPGAATVASPSAAASSGLVIVVRTDRDSWISASADGQRVTYRLMPAGSEETLRASREISLRAGDAGAVRLTINGRDAGVFGNAGEVRTGRITPADAGKFLASPAAR